MTQDVATQEDNSPEAIFRAKIKDRIRSDVGNLMPDEMLSSLISDAIRAELYRDTRPANQSWGQPQPWVRGEVERVLSAKMKEILDEELSSREDEVREMIVAKIKDCIPAILGEVVMALVKSQIFQLEQRVGDALREGRI